MNYYITPKIPKPSPAPSNRTVGRNNIPDYAADLIEARRALHRCESLFALVAAGQPSQRKEASDEAGKALSACVSLCQWINSSKREG